MATSAPNALIDARAPAQRLLEFVVSDWQERGWPLPVDENGDVVAYLAAGDPNSVADDNPALVVTLAQLSPGPAVPREGVPAKGLGSIVMAAATYEVRLMRTTPVWDEHAPPPEAIQESALDLLDDPGRLMTSLLAWSRKEKLETSKNGPWQIGTLRPEGPNGGHVGHAVQVTVSPVQ